MSVSPVFASLNNDQAKELLIKHGPKILFDTLTKNYGGLLQTGSSLYTDYKTRQGIEEQHQALEAFKEALPKLINLIESMEIRVPPGAFNSSPYFTTAFQSVAALGTVLILMDLRSAIKRVGSSLEAIRNELAVGIVAKAQGWERDGFGSHIYRFVQNEMAQSGEDHFFYVWHPDTDWYQTFEERQRELPLGPNFGGYNSDLGTICLLMGTNRYTLRERSSKAVFHLLIPAYYPIVIDKPIIFHQSLFPLVIKGQRHRQADFVWFNLPYKPTGLTLEEVGTLTEKLNKPVKFGLTGFVSCWCGAAGCAIASTVFPPCAPAAASWGVGFCQAGVAYWATMAGGIIYESFSSDGPRILGLPVIISPQLVPEDVD
jgi:hypothetical protein